MLDINIWLQTFANPVLNNVMLALSYIPTEIPVFLLIAYLYWCVDKRKGLYAGFTIIFCMQFNFLLKNIFKVDRPYIKDKRIVDLDKKLSYGYSFPSNHVQNTAVTAVSIYKSFDRKNILIIGLCLTAVMMIVRMYLGVHSLLDVFAGAAVGIALSYFVYNFIEKAVSEKKYIYILISGLIFIVFYYIFKDKDILKLFCLYVGIMGGFFAENKYIDVKPAQTSKAKLLEYIIGIAIGVVIMKSMSSCFKYVLFGLWVSLGAPFTFVMIRRFKDECKKNK